MFLTGYQTDFRGYLTYFCTLSLQLGFAKKFRIYWLKPLLKKKTASHTHMHIFWGVKIECTLFSDMPLILTA